MAAVRAAGSSKVEDALAKALGSTEAARLPEVTEALELLARHLVREAR
ncbi:MULTISPECIES: hypothetical protein [unclassified Streptomyces]